MQKPIIKTHSNRNRYILTPSGYWVRDMFGSAVPVDLNKFFPKEEIKYLAQNEMGNITLKIPDIGSDRLPNLPKIIIASDGYLFKQKKHILEQLPGDVCLIGVNGSLKHWNVNERGVVKRPMNYYFVNNPYADCMRFMPIHKYRPRCIASIRTYNSFLKKYIGNKYFYIPTSDGKFGYKHRGSKRLDDYRNPICGALSFAASCNVRKLCLFCCDDAFADQRPASIQLDNGLWTYDQHRITNELIDGMLYWMKEQEDCDVQVTSHSSGLEYQRAKYIELEGVLEFFNE